MAKKDKQEKAANQDKENLQGLSPEMVPPEIAKLMPKITPEMQEKMKQIKVKLDSFSKQLLEKFEKYVIGIALLPPESQKPQEETKADTLMRGPSGMQEKPHNPDQINVLVLVDDSDTKKMSKEELHGRLSQIIDELARKIDENIMPEVMIVSDLKEACYDGKTEILKMISMTAPIYDPSDLLAALRISEVHKTMVLKKFEKYIVSYVAAGSLFRGEKSHDIDVYVVIDDTDVKKMSRAELKEKLRAIIVSMGFEASRLTGVKKQFHVQTYILTDFWDSVKDANPVIYTFLRDGVPLYDRGVFMPWKLLLQMGRIRPSPEAIDMNMDLGERLLVRIKQKMLSVVGEDLYYAVLNPAQAALMLYGIPPPTPKETIKLLDEIFVQKEKLLEKKYVDILEKIRKAYKDIEYGKLNEVSGKQIDELLKDAEDYLKRIKVMFKQIEERTEKESIINVHANCVSATKDLLKELGHNEAKEQDLVKLFKEVIVHKTSLPEKLSLTLKEVIAAKEAFLADKLSRNELNKVKKEARNYIKAVVEELQSRKASLLDRSRIRFKYDNKIGEALVLGDTLFITKDLEQKDSLFIAKFANDGTISDIKKSSPEELEKHLSNLVSTKQAFITEKLFEGLKQIAGKEIEIMLG